MRIYTVHAQCVGKIKDGFFGAAVWGVGEVCSNLQYLSSYTHYRTRTLLPPIFLISPTAVPSCLTPVMQHWPGGRDAIVYARKKRMNELKDDLLDGDNVLSGNWKR